MITSILVYIPAGKIADRIGRKPFVILTFLSFALFPIAIIVASNFAVDRRFCDWRSARDRRAFKKGDDRRLCTGQHSRQICRALLSYSQSFNYTGSGDWRAALENRATSAVRYGGIHRTGWHLVFIVTVDERYAS